MKILEQYKSTNILTNSSYRYLPRSLPIIKLGTNYNKLSGHIKLSELNRLTTLLISDTNKEVYVQLEFKLIAKKKVIVTGSINQQVTLVCQRCLESMEYVIDSKIAVVLIDKISRIDGSIEQELESDGNLVDFEVIDINDQEVLDLYALIEDEMILSLPSSARHDDDDLECQKNYSNLTTEL